MPEAIFSTLASASRYFAKLGSMILMRTSGYRWLGCHCPQARGKAANVPIAVPAATKLLRFIAIICSPSDDELALPAWPCKKPSGQRNTTKSQRQIRENHILFNTPPTLYLACDEFALISKTLGRRAGVVLAKNRDDITLAQLQNVPTKSGTFCCDTGPRTGNPLHIVSAWDKNGEAPRF
jgi:hypothetical protein